MKLFHLSDLHIGKQLNGYSLRENQEAVLRQIVEAAGEQKPDAILICGDIYDKSVPSGEACDIFNHFLEELADIRTQIPVLIIAGNHDSPERLRFASSFLERHKIYISVLPPEEKGEYLKKITLYDEHGPVNFYMLPFMRPGYVRQMIEEERKEQGKGGLKSFGYDEAVKAVLDREFIAEKERNVLLSHQFYIWGDKHPDTCDSELAAAAAGGLDSIDIKAVSAFDYVHWDISTAPKKWEIIKFDTAVPHTNIQ
ncbi:exonuclease subunit SbcD [Clostridium sp. AM58-1XD]|uniref:metallophosphoesterase family protein n=1 Tax=Clostridium sp. AM58-1XD TaxID=2292307 RepID=UPI001FA87ABB|nr:exonuclease subunit SbcD [Clostridium sp. AM58-1XD]